MPTMKQFFEWHKHPALVRCPCCAKVDLTHCFLCNDHTYIPLKLALRYEQSVFKSSSEIAKLRVLFMAELREAHKAKEFIRKAVIGEK